MSSSLTRTEVEKIAALAHLDLTPDEIEQLTGQLTQILAYAECLQEVDTSSVTGTWRPPTDHESLRPDVVRTPLRNDEAVANAPVPAVRGLFRVPKVIGS